jgi:hypothetical protein
MAKAGVPTRIVCSIAAKNPRSITAAQANFLIRR